MSFVSIVEKQLILKIHLIKVPEFIPNESQATGYSYQTLHIPIPIPISIIWNRYGIHLNFLESFGILGVP